MELPIEELEEQVEKLKEELEEKLAEEEEAGSIASIAQMDYDDALYELNARKEEGEKR